MGITDSILSNVKSLSSPYGNASTGQWNLSKGTFTNSSTSASVVFYYETKDTDLTQKTAIDQITDSAGRRLAIYEYPYRDGQAVADLGRKAETFQFNVKFWGLNYQAKLAEFLTVANTQYAGALSHPTRGVFQVRFRDMEAITRYDEFNAVTLRVTFVEDNTKEIQANATTLASPDSALRNSVQSIASNQAAISASISNVSGLLNLPQTIKDGVQNRINSITNQASGLVGQLASTFGGSKNTQSVAAAASNVGGVAALSSGTAVKIGDTTASSLPPVFQVGFDAATQATIEANTAAFVNANQITPQQAVFTANQARQAISAAITEINSTFGNDGADMVLAYRRIAISIQEAVEASIASQQNLINKYVVPRPMSLRMVAFLNGLTPDRQNDIESLNPYISSINYVPAGTIVTVPVS